MGPHDPLESARIARPSRPAGGMTRIHHHGRSHSQGSGSIAWPQPMHLVAQWNDLGRRWSPIHVATWFRSRLGQAHLFDLDGSSSVVDPSLEMTLAPSSKGSWWVDWRQILMTAFLVCKLFIRHERAQDTLWCVRSVELLQQPGTAAGRWNEKNMCEMLIFCMIKKNKYICNLRLFIVFLNYIFWNDELTMFKMEWFIKFVNNTGSNK